MTIVVFNSLFPPSHVFLFIAARAAAQIMFGSVFHTTLHTTLEKNGEAATWLEVVLDSFVGECLPKCRSNRFFGPPAMQLD
jgi:hypothetical protein